jgi:hypothetical protein
MPGQDHPIELQNLLLESEQLGTERGKACAGNLPPGCRSGRQHYRHKTDLPLPKPDVCFLAEERTRAWTLFDFR